MVKHEVLDRVGFATSFACSIHCMVMPFLVAILPLIGLSWLADERIERVFLCFSAILAVSSICWGFKKHRKVHVLCILSMGIALMVVGHMAEETPWGVFVAVTGGLSIAASHFINQKLCKTCHTCGDH